MLTTIRNDWSLGSVLSTHASAISGNQRPLTGYLVLCMGFTTMILVKVCTWLFRKKNIDVPLVLFDCEFSEQGIMYLFNEILESWFCEK
jgi:hypothetical protein